jgi:hypothetical protein
MNNKEILQMALEALSAPNQGPLVNTLKNKAIDALVSALAQPEQQSVPMSEYKTLHALVTSQGIRLMEYESQPEPLNIWRETVNEQCSTAYTWLYEDDPKKTIENLIERHCELATECHRSNL